MEYFRIWEKFSEASTMTNYFLVIEVWKFMLLYRINSNSSEGVTMDTFVDLPIQIENQFPRIVNRWNNPLSIFCMNFTMLFLSFLVWNSLNSVYWKQICREVVKRDKCIIIVGIFNSDNNDNFAAGNRFLMELNLNWLFLN